QEEGREDQEQRHRVGEGVRPEGAVDGRQRHLDGHDGRPGGKQGPGDPDRARPQCFVPSPSAPAGPVPHRRRPGTVTDRSSRYRRRRNRAAAGAATRPPTPPSSTMTANARSPRKPMNQAWVGRESPVPNSAVPVLPATPSGRPASAAVPWVTTWRIRVRRVPAAAACGGGPGGAPAPPPTAGVVGA